MRAKRRYNTRLKKQRVDKYKKHEIHINSRMCSCHMCGNPRKHWNEKTIQEKREDQ